MEVRTLTVGAVAIASEIGSCSTEFDRNHHPTPPDKTRKNASKVRTLVLSQL
jgi:hypothetical protein